MFRITILALHFLLLTVTTEAAHPSHSSITEVEWNTKSQRFEIAMRLCIADFEDAISLRLNRRYQLESDKNAAVQVQQYLQDCFAVTVSERHECTLHWVGMELELHDVWFYFEAESQPSKPVGDSSINSEHSVASWDDLLSSTDGEKVSAANKVGVLNSVSIKNAVLTEVQPEQSNIVNIISGRLTSSAVLTAQKTQDFLALKPTGLSSNSVRHVE